MQARVIILKILILVSVILVSCESPKPVLLVRGDCPVGSLMAGKNCIVSVGTKCKGGNDCIGGFCISGYDERYCSQRCTEDYDCPLGYFCSRTGSEKLCVKSIYSRTICNHDQECGPCGLCIANLCEISPFCVVTLCMADSDCGSCRVCEDGQCAPIERCGRSCNSNLDCDPSQICDRDYQGRLACIPRLPNEIGMYCDGTDARQCNSSICLSTDGYPLSYCSRRCSNDADCPYDYYCGVFPSYPGGNVCIKRGVYRPDRCNSSEDCMYDLKCRYAYLEDRSGITTFCGILNNGAVSTYFCDKDIECRWGMCGRPSYYKDSDRGICTRPCSEDFDCPDGYVCEDMLSVDEGLGYRGCVKYQDVKKDIGEFCTYSPDECKSGICVDHNDSSIPYCSSDCSDDTDCPLGYSCMPFNDSNLCQMKEDPKPCFSDRDCEVGSYCAVIDGEIGCVKFLQEVSLVGEECRHPCSSGICLSGYNRCSAFCQGLQDCPEGYVCLFADINLEGNESSRSRICYPDPGSLYPCVRDEGCPRGEYCRVNFDSRSGYIEPVCVRVQDTLRDYREDCLSNDDCKSGICLFSDSPDIVSSGLCSRFCAEDDDCRDGDVCRTVPYYYSRDYAVPVRICAREPIPFEVGQGCASNPSSCISGFCQNLEDRVAICTERCRDHYDCIKSLTVCRLVDRIGTICLPVNYFQEE